MLNLFRRRMVCGQLSPQTFRALSVAVAAGVFGWTYVFGHWGIYAFDQSEMFDGGWRILCGQVPYRDFLMAYTPLAFAIQAVFFKLCGVTWTATVVSAATLGSILSLSVIRTMVLLFGSERRWLALFTGGLVGAAFEGIFGTLWIENCAFFFCFLGIQAVCESLPAGSWHPKLGFATAGMAVMLSFLCKQNVGPLAGALLLAMVVLAAPLQLKIMLANVFNFLIGAGLIAGIFVLWLVTYSDPHLFIHHALQVPAAVGSGRFYSIGVFYLPDLLSSVSRTTTWCNVAALGAVGYTLLYGWFRGEKWRQLKTDPRRRLMLLLAGTLPLVQAIFQISSNNFHQNLLFLSAATWGLGAGVWAECRLPPVFRPWLRSTLAIVGLILAYDTVYSTFTRNVHASFPEDGRRTRKLVIAPLARVSWISPTLTQWIAAYNPEVLMPEDIERTYDYLIATHQRFYLMGDSNYLYGITGVSPPGPLLYYQLNHYFTAEDLPKLDEWTLANLKKDDIRVVVREKHMFLYPIFPLAKTRQWVEKNFAPGPVFGHYAIWLRKTEPAPPARQDKPSR